MGEPRGSRARVVIVDADSASSASLRRVLLADSDVDIECHADADAALRSLDADPTDLLIIDVDGPGHEDLRLLKQFVARRGPDDFLPVLVVTRDRTGESHLRALLAGATDLLQKPIDATEAALRVRNLLQTRALHVRLRRHGEVLAARLDQQEAMERRLVEELEERRARIEGVLAGLGLTILFQPIVELAGSTVLGVEALARFSTGPQRVPDVWFSEAAEVGLGPDLEIAAISMAVDQFDGIPPLAYLSLNVSAATVLSGLLKAALHDVPFERVVLELTEHDAVDDYDALNRALSEMRAEGVRLAVDDAGAGFSSLRHILSLQPDIIKLDLALTRGIAEDPVRRALAASLVSFAREIDASITAEGVETEAELAVLQQLGVPSAQGFYLSRPIPLPIPDDLQGDSD